MKCFWFCDFCAGQWNQGGEETTTQVTIPKDVRIWFRRFYFIVCNFCVFLLISLMLEMMGGVLFVCFFLVIASGINYWKRRGENKANQVRYFIIVQILNIH